MTKEELLLAQAQQALDARNTGALAGNHDVDTLDMVNEVGVPQRIRVAGIDGPEFEQPLGPAAGQALRDVVGGGAIRLDGPQTTDVYGRTVSRVARQDGTDVGALLTKEGMAAVPPVFGDEDMDRRDGLNLLQREAQIYGKGMWASNAASKEMPWEYRNRIAREQGKARGEYQKQGTILEDIGGAFDYAGNVVRSGLAGALDPRGTAAQFAGQAAQKHRYTSESDLKDSFTKNVMGMSKPWRVGVDDGKFSAGDVVDTAVDVGIGVLTDPLTYLGGPLVKGMGKVVRGVGEAAGVAKLAGATDSAVGRVALGTALGAGVVGNGGDEDDTSVTKRLGGAVLGGIGAAFAPNLAKGVSGAARTMTDGLVDQYMRITRGAEDYSAKARLARESVDTAMNNASAGAMRYKTNVLNPLDPPDKLAFVGLLEEGKSWEVGERNAFLNANPKATVGEAQAAFANIKAQSQARLRDRSAALGQQFVKATEASFVENERMMTKVNLALPKDAPKISGFGAYWPDLWASEPGVFDSVSASFGDLKIQRASSQLRQQSQNAMAVESFLKSGGAGLAKDDASQALRILGQRHGMKPEEFDVLLKAQPAVVQDFVGRYLSGKVKIPEEFILKGIDDTVDVYFRRYGWHTVDDTARKAIEYIADVMDRPIGFGAKTGEMAGSKPAREVLGDPSKFGFYRGLEKTMGAWDVAQAFVVRNQLFGGLGWLKNNFWENSLKAYMSGGLAGMMDSTMFNAARKGVFDDVWKMTAGGGSSVMKSAAAEDLARAVELGVVSNPSARALGGGKSADLQKFMYSEMGLKRAMDKAAAIDSRNALTKGLDAWGEALAGSVGRLGSTLENTSRFMSWQRMRDAMRKAKPEWAKDAKLAEYIDHHAAEFIKRTYYDYGDISEFNRLVTKRIAPYASYYMKNIPYYISAAFDTSRIGDEVMSRAMRTQMVERAISHFGGTPTDQDKEGFTDYLLANRPRIFGRGPEGLSVGVMPSFSRDDAIRMLGITRPGEMLGSYLEKVNPMIKAPVEVLSGHDFFTGGPLYPSDIPAKKGEQTGRKYLFGRGFLPAAVGAADVDKRGNPYSQSDAYVAFDKLRSAFLPLPGVEAAASIIGQDAYGKRSAGSGLWNKTLNPMQDVDVSREMMQIQRTLKAKARKDKEYGK